MLAWFARHRTQRFGRLAQLIRRHQLVALRPPPGAIMREALGLAPRFHTLARFHPALDGTAVRRAGAEPIRAARPIPTPLLTRTPMALGQPVPAPLAAAPADEAIRFESPELATQTEPSSIVEHEAVIAAVPDAPIAIEPAAEVGVESAPEPVESVQATVAPEPRPAGLAPSIAGPPSSETVVESSPPLPRGGEVRPAPAPGIESTRAATPPGPVNAPRSDSASVVRPGAPTVAVEPPARPPTVRPAPMPSESLSAVRDGDTSAPIAAPDGVPGRAEDTVPATERIEPSIVGPVAPTAEVSAPAELEPRAGEPTGAGVPRSELPTGERAISAPPNDEVSSAPRLEPARAPEAAAAEAASLPRPDQGEAGPPAVTEPPAGVRIERSEPTVPSESRAEAPPAARTEAAEPASVPNDSPRPSERVTPAAELPPVASPAAPEAPPSEVGLAPPAIAATRESASEPGEAARPVASSPESVAPAPAPALAPPAAPAASTGPGRFTPNEERQARHPLRSPLRQPAQSTAPEPGRPTEPPVRDIETILAQPDEAPAEPSVWLERLRRAFAPEGAPPESRPPVPKPEPISLANRDLLTPLLGRDPGAVTVRQGGIVSKAVTRLGADAVAVGEEILVAEGHPQGDPKSTGLLAHELVHTARRRSARFVPPVLGERSPGSADPVRFAPALGRSPSPGSESPARAPAALVPRTDRPVPAADDNEESVALATEGAVTAIAERRQRGEPARFPARSGRSEAAATDALAPGQPTPATTERPPWGNLPAPWEPIPDFGVPAEPSRELVVAAPASEGSSTGTVHRAPTGRAAAAPGGSAPAGSPAGGASVDVDALARQVYGILKRRLSDERRRAM